VNERPETLVERAVDVAIAVVCVFGLLCLMLGVFPPGN
jgi:hypothetical protein